MVGGRGEGDTSVLHPPTLAHHTRYLNNSHTLYESVHCTYSTIHVHTVHTEQYMYTLYVQYSTYIHTVHTEQYMYICTVQYMYTLYIQYITCIHTVHTEQYMYPLCIHSGWGTCTVHVLYCTYSTVHVHTYIQCTV